MDLQGKAFFCISSTNPVRVMAGRVVTHPWFDPVVLLFIFLSNVFLALDSPFVDADMYKFLYYADLVMTGVFTIEMLLKMLVYGLAIGKNSYLRNGWNIVDFVIVTSAYANLMVGYEAGFKGLRTLRVLRALRSLRALRMVSHMERLKIVIRSLLATVVM